MNKKIVLDDISKEDHHKLHEYLFGKYYQGMDYDLNKNILTVYKDEVLEDMKVKELLVKVKF